MEPFNQEKVYFVPGNLVTIKHDLPNKPVMLVKSKKTALIKRDNGTHFEGMLCIWFTSDGSLQESVFSTKDLEHYLSDKL